MDGGPLLQWALIDDVVVVVVVVLCLCRWCVNWADLGVNYGLEVL